MSGADSLLRLNWLLHGAELGRPKEITDEDDALCSISSVVAVCQHVVRCGQSWLQ